MVVKSNLHGQESKQKYNHVTLEEHLKCGCQCKDVSAAGRAGIFNAQTFECKCKGSLMKTHIYACTKRAATYWDYKMCQCQLKKRHHDCVATIYEL